MKYQNFKKLLMTPMLIIILVMSLIGCGQAAPADDEDDDDEEKYELILDRGFKCDETEYAEGDKVKVYYDIIATDTDYRFYTDSDDVDLTVDYSDKKGYIIKFRMPDHDVELHVDSYNTMEPYIEPSVTDENDIKWIDYTSPDSVLEFAVGEWKLVDKETGTVYGKLNVYEDGTCDYYNMKDSNTLYGSMSFNAPAGAFISGIHGYELTFSGLESAYDAWRDEDTSSGLFRFAQTAGRDYMYLEELGNGGSSVAYYVLAGLDEFDYDFRWVFTRDNDVTVEGSPIQNGYFFAMLMENGSNGVLLQEVAEAVGESQNEYTGFRFMAAQFYDFPGKEAAWYKYSSKIDFTYVLDKDRLDDSYPAIIYEVTTDSRGDIISIREVERAAYGEYELYSLEQYVTVDGTTFDINDYVFDISDFGGIGNAIMDYQVFGDYVIIESHINPHRSEYMIFDMRSAWPVNMLYGCNYIFEDYVWDGFYSDMDTVYDYEGHPVYTVDGTEICGLSFSEDGSMIDIEYWKDTSGTVYEDSIERPDCLNAPIYALAQYRHHQNANNWVFFTNYAPTNALYMAMVNPPEDESWIYYMPYELEDGGTDILYVIALQDDTRIDFGDGMYDILSKGEMAAFSLTVPEGAPRLTLTAETPDGRISEWGITMISGRDDTRWIFN